MYNNISIATGVMFLSLGIKLVFAFNSTVAHVLLLSSFKNVLCYFEVCFLQPVGFFDHLKGNIKLWSLILLVRCKTTYS